MRALEASLRGNGAEVPVGGLAERDRVIYFEYDAAFLAHPLPLSPFELPMGPGLAQHADGDFADVFGVINDSLLAEWPRFARSTGVSETRIREIGRVLASLE